MSDSETSKPLVTIGIPTYNRVKGLKYTLNCVKQQSYDNIEILIADNCTEPKYEIDALIESYADDKRIKYFRHEQNKGPMFNFEFLLQKAKGDYFIWFCDDDHYDDRKFIERYVATLKANPKASFAMGSIEYVDGSGEVFIKDNPPYHMNGKIFWRFWTYLTTDITDNLMYGMLRTKIVRNYKFERNVSTPEKFLIFFLLAKGSLADCPSASYKNIYSFKSGAEVMECLGGGITRKHFLVWINVIYRYLPLRQAVIFSILYILVKAPKTSWPIRRLFGFPRVHPGRVQFFNPIKEIDQ